MNQALARIGALTGIEDKSARLAWVFLFLLIPFSLALRCFGLDQPMMDPHPVRSLMTAISTQMIAQGKGNLFRYHYPDPRISNLVYEFPLYQWLVAKTMGWGVGLEVASRLTTIFFFLAGTVVFGTIVRRLLGREAAAWGVVLYLLSPYNTVYSRTGLLDFTFVFFLLVMLWSVVEILPREKARTWDRVPRWAWWSGLTLSGSTAALMKANVWAVPALFACGYLGSLFFRKQISRRLLLQFAACFLFQACLAVAWTQWAMKVRGEAAGVPQPSWYIGSLAMRLESYRWRAILVPFFRSMLHDWMIIPFIAGLAVPTTRRWTAAAAAIVAINILVFFHVHSVHDYYLVASSPFVFFVVAAGMPALFRFPIKPKCVALGIMLFLLATRVPKLPLVFGHIFRDHRPQVAFALAMKKRTTESDLLFINGDNRDIYTLLVYAERPTVPVEAAHQLANYPQNSIGFEPTFYIVRDGQAPTELLARRAQLPAVVLPGGFQAYRARRIK